MTQKLAWFYDSRRPLAVWRCNSSSFQSMCSNCAIKDRSYLRGYITKGRLDTNVFQDTWLGRINPFWVKYFAFQGPYTPNAEAQLLYEKHLRIPLSRRPSQNKKGYEDGAKRPKSSRSKAGKSVFTKIEKISPIVNYSLTGRATYTGQYSYWGAYNNLHVVSYRSVTKASVNTPNFRKIKKRDLPMNPFSYTLDFFNETAGTYRDYAPGSDVRLTGYLRGTTYGGFTGFNLDPYMGASTSVGAKALSKCMSRSKGMKVNLAQIYGERKQTVNLLTTSVLRIFKLAFALKKGNIAEARKLLNGYQGKDSFKKVSVWNHTGTFVIGKRFIHTRRSSKASQDPSLFANLWLEYTYGWKPLLSDIYGACEELADTFYAPKMLKISATSSEVKTSLITPPAQMAAWEKVTRVETNRGHVVFFFAEPTEWTNTLSRTGLTNPAHLAWELMPYSFVIDWIAPIGAYLSNLDATVGLNFIKGSTSVNTRVDVVSVVASHVIANHSYTYTGNVLNRSRITKVRTCYTSVPNVPLPVISPNLGVERTLSALSLLTQLFVGGKTSLR